MRQWVSTKCILLIDLRVCLDTLYLIIILCLLFDFVRSELIGKFQCVVSDKGGSRNNSDYCSL